MDELRRRFASLDRLPAPDLWAQIEQRATAMEPVARVSGVVTPVSVRPRRSGARSVLVYLAAAACLVALVAGAAAVGSGLVRLPAIVPAPSESASLAPSPAPSTPVASNTPEPSVIASGRDAGWILFDVHEGSGTRSHNQLWAIRPDGSGAHAIEGGAGPVAWSPDGTRLLMNNGHLLVAEVGDDVGPFAETGIAVADGAQWEAFDFARDNERVVFVQRGRSARRDRPPPALRSSGVVLAAYAAETAGADCWVLSTLGPGAAERGTELRETLRQGPDRSSRTWRWSCAWSPMARRSLYPSGSGSRHPRAVDRQRRAARNPSKVQLDANVW